MSFLGEQIRADFPALAHGYAFFDAPGGTQMPRQVAERMRATALQPISYRSTGSRPGRNADDAVLAFRAATATLLGAEPFGVVHGRSATQLTMEFARTLSSQWEPGDNVVLSLLDHDANITPWVLAAARSGVKVRWARFDIETGELPAANVAQLVDRRTRLVAVTGASNLLGTRPDVPAIAAAAHAVGALVYVDGVHLTAHAPIDVRELGADFFVASPYKLFGPHCAVLVAAPELLDTLQPDKLVPSSNAVPERFELGTLPYELLAGVTAMVDYLAGLAPAGAVAAGASRRERLVAAMRAIDEAELVLRERIEDAIAELPRIRLRSRAAMRTSTLFMTIEGVDPRDAEAALRERGVLAQAGNFYAARACAELGLGEEGGLRVGLAPYTSANDVDRLIAGLREIAG